MFGNKYSIFKIVRWAKHILLLLKQQNDVFMKIDVDLPKFDIPKDFIVGDGITGDILNM